jgi:hypothetical protein
MRILLRLAQLVELVRLNREIHCERAPLTFDAGGERSGWCLPSFRYSSSCYVLFFLVFLSSFFILLLPLWVAQL